MLINVFLLIFALIGICVLIYYLVCVYKQYRQTHSLEIVELFPKEDIYLENAYEGAEFHMSLEDKRNSERWAAIQRGSVRIACGVYFTSDEYMKYKENVLSMELP